MPRATQKPATRFGRNAVSAFSRQPRLEVPFISLGNSHERRDRPPCPQDGFHSIFWSRSTAIHAGAASFPRGSRMFLGCEQRNPLSSVLVWRVSPHAALNHGSHSFPSHPHGGCHLLISGVPATAIFPLYLLSIPSTSSPLLTQSPAGAHDGDHTLKCISYTQLSIGTHSACSRGAI